MLGDLVEYCIALAPGAGVEIGQTIGSIEGFKAVADIYCVASGEYLGPNPELAQDPTLLDRDPYDRGWLYRLRCSPTEAALDVSGYMQHLDATIDRMLDPSQQQTGKLVLKVQYIMVGGFLGAGKTTAIAQLARRWQAQGQRRGSLPTTKVSAWSIPLPCARRAFPLRKSPAAAFAADSIRFARQPTS